MLGGSSSGKKVVSSENMDLGSPRGAKLSARQQEPQYDDHENQDGDYEDEMQQESDYPVHQSNDRPIKSK